MQVVPLIGAIVSIIQYFTYKKKHEGKEKWREIGGGNRGKGREKWREK